MAHIEKKHFEVLDGLRGVAALAVVIFHFMEWVQPDYSKSFIGHGFLAVDFFFCLSGFVIAYAYDDRIGKLGLGEFFRSRFIRLHPLVVVGSVLGLLGFLFNPLGASQHLGFLRVGEIFLCSILVIPFPTMASTFFNLFGLNAPAWSLFWEYIANIFYGLVLCRIGRRYLAWLLVPAAAGMFLVIYKSGSLLGGWSGGTFWDGFARVSYSFLAGMVLYRFGWVVKNRLGFLLVGVLLLVALLSPFSTKWNLLTESLIVLVYFPFVIAVGAGTTPAAWVRRFCVFLGQLSYPLYMTHYWLIWIFGDYFTKYKPAGVRLFFIVAGLLAVQVVLAYVVMRWYDTPVRRALGKGWGRKTVAGLIVLLLFCSFDGMAQQHVFVVVTKTAKVSIVYGADGPKLDSIVAHLLAEDIERVTGYRPVVGTDVAAVRGNVIVIGGVGSPVIERVAGRSPVVSGLAGKQECFGLAVVDKPLPGVGKALVIAGSDPRGTAYGVFTISGKIGVSPWYWWADVPTKKREELVVEQPDSVSAAPSVRYRGIFINDEDYGLRPWAAHTFEPETKNIGPRTYAKVFELLLRLKANFIWPAMHPNTKPFFSLPGNKEMAALYHIVVGSSHAEPMLRNNVGEWNEKTMGDFNYLTNKAKIDAYWEDRVKDADTGEVVYTVGMRGVHDGQMEGVNSAGEAVPLLEQIFNVQRDMLVRDNHKAIGEIPQAFTPYKEVLEFYDNGLKVPDDITLVWPDDNYGYIQRLSNEEERKRAGSAGVYYHVSYWGRPHDYLWLSTTHPALLREEMMKAYETGADRIWVLNVGDIKPAEYDIQLFLDMAYDVTPFKESRYSRTHLLHWYQRIFGVGAGAIADVVFKYYDLAFERRPEFMGWSGTEPITDTRYTAYNHFFYGDQAQHRIDYYNDLESRVERMRGNIDPAAAAAFYELVYYPVVGAAEMNKKFLYRDKAYLYGRQNRISSYDYALKATEAYKRIVKETRYYNDSLAGGKWKNMMDLNPRNLPVYQSPFFKPPVAPPIVHEHGKGWAISPEGCDTAGSDKPALPEFTAGLLRSYFIDVFLCDSAAVEWKAVASAGWIRLSDWKGTLSPERDKDQKRLRVEVDWTKAPMRERNDGVITFSGAGKRFTVGVTALRRDSAVFNESIEANGYVSIHAWHYREMLNKSNFPWEKIIGLGCTAAVMRAGSSPLTAAPMDSAMVRNLGSCLRYDFLTFGNGPADIIFYALPTLPLNKNYKVRCAFSVDEGPLQFVDFTSNSTARTEEWKQNVLSNSAIRTVTGFQLKPGKHTLTIYSVDPGVILDRFVIDLGGFKPAYGVVDETR